MLAQSATDNPALYTLGHSTRTLEAFLDLLRAYRIALLVDVRTVPKSRRVPQFNKDSLEIFLPKRKIEYLHLPALGGLRKSRGADSPNQGWRNASFRGFADYMGTEGFEKGIDALLSQAAGRRSAMMCAEAVPWRCHRSLIADALLIRGIPIRHILSPTQAQEHRLTSFARVVGKKIVYPPPEDQRSLFHGGA